MTSCWEVPTSRFLLSLSTSGQRPCCFAFDTAAPNHVDLHGAASMQLLFPSAAPLVRQQLCAVVFFSRCSARLSSPRLIPRNQTELQTLFMCIIAATPAAVTGREHMQVKRDSAESTCACLKENHSTLPPAASSATHKRAYVLFSLIVFIFSFEENK